MKIALFGYGKMGKEIESIALERGHSIVLKIDKNDGALKTPDTLKQAEVAIEFSTPDSVIGNIEACFAANLPIVVGTTGWNARHSEIEQKCKSSNNTLFHASNFSLGVNLFFMLNQKLAALMNRFPEYNVSMEEIHHIHKMDKPSGTAISLAQQIIEKHSSYNNWSLGSVNKNELWIDVKRENEVPGTHIVRYESEVDSIEIGHYAKSRKGFALGAVLAAEFIHDKRGVFGMNDLLAIN